MDNLLIVKNFTSISPHTKLALFDLDDTLIKYLPNSSNIVMKKPKIKERFQELNRNNYFIAILSNQMDMLDTAEKKEKFTLKIEKLMKNLDVPILFIAALQRDFYRKPAPGMLEIVKQYVHSPDLPKSFYCGDAAGRKHDHSDCDLKLAINMDVRFMTPEMFFDNDKKNFTINFIHIKEYKFKFDEKSNTNDLIFVYGKGRNSGKTFFAEKYFKNREVKINCLDFAFIKKVKNCKCYFLNYDENVLRWLKIFCELTGKKSKGGSRKFDFGKVKGCFKEVVEVKFHYDDEGYSEEQRTVAKLVL